MEAALGEITAGNSRGKGKTKLFQCQSSSGKLGSPRSMGARRGLESCKENEATGGIGNLTSVLSSLTWAALKAGRTNQICFLGATVRSTEGPEGHANVVAGKLQPDKRAANSRSLQKASAEDEQDEGGKGPRRVTGRAQVADRIAGVGKELCAGLVSFVATGPRGPAVASQRLAHEQPFNVLNICRYTKYIYFFWGGTARNAASQDRTLSENLKFSPTVEEPSALLRDLLREMKCRDCGHAATS